MLRATLLLLTLLAISCGDEREVDALIDDFETHVQTLRAINADHARAIDDASDLPAMHEIEGRHRTRMMLELSGFEDTIARMETCHQICRMDSLMMDEMREGLDRHQDAMLSALEVESARTEERRHQRETSDMTMAGMPCRHGD